MPFRFRRYCRGAYAAFNSLHREVTIGHIASYIADRQLRKSAATVCLSAMLFFATTAIAQDIPDPDELTDTAVLPTLVITASYDSTSPSHGATAALSSAHIQNITASTVGQLLEVLPTVEVRQRGAADMQGDIVMRGGTFDQAVILLNGVNFSDVQTGHHNLDLPIPFGQLQRVEVLSPTALMRYGVASFCGGINLITTPDTTPLRIDLQGGSYGSARAMLSLSTQRRGWHTSLHGSYQRSDGYRHNTDYNGATFFLQSVRTTCNGRWTIQAGAQAKGFGSQDFYSTRYPDQYEATQTLLASVHHQHQLGDWLLDATLYGRLHRDRFELFRKGRVLAPAWYGGPNHHLASSSGLRLRASRRWLLGTSSLGAEYRREGIVSNVLGDSLQHPITLLGASAAVQYTMGKQRHRAIMSAHHTIALKYWNFAASATAEGNTMGGPTMGAAASAEWCPLPYLGATALVSTSRRQPTFTDLYYHSATQMANPALNAEQSTIQELRLRYRRDAFLVSGGAYLRQGNHIIDWVRHPDSTVWHSLNLTRVDAFGADIVASYNGNGVLRMAQLSYAYCTLRQQASDFISAYALDYLRHKLSADITVAPCSHWLLRTHLAWQQRQGHYTSLDGALQSYRPVLLLDAEIDYSIKQFTIYATMTNLLNRTYCDYGGIPQPGTMAMLGVRWHR